jgi:predicted CXXCH cytochrome family protein
MSPAKSQLKTKEDTRFMKLRLYALVTGLGLASVSMLMGAAANLPKSGLAGTTHDIGAKGCVSCHAPHNGGLANGGPQGSGLILLWSRAFPATANTFGVYQSATMSTTPAELGGSALTTSTDTRMYSLLCLSCHDGVTSTFSPAMQTKNMIGSKASFGTGAYDSLGLTNDHPVNNPYPTPTQNPSMVAVATVSNTLPLYGTTNTMQCATCHDPHNNTNTNYLRQVDNSAHCLTCHT